MLNQLCKIALLVTSTHTTFDIYIIYNNNIHISTVFDLESFVQCAWRGSSVIWIIIWKCFGYMQ